MVALNQVVKLLSAMVIIGAIPVAGAQDYPVKAIRIMAGEAGSNSDFSARLLGQGLSAALNQPVVIENRPTNVLPSLVAKAPADGYTLYMTGSVAWVSPLLRKVDYDGVRDFAPITWMTMSPYLLIVHPSLPVKNVQELITLAKAKPGELNVGGGGLGGPSMLAVELFQSMAGVKITRVNYKGTTSSLNGLVTGELQMHFANEESLKAFEKAGRIRVLGVSSAEPTALFPGVPTIAASGLPGYEAVSVQGLLAPARVPAAVIDRVYQDSVRFLGRAENKEKYLAIGSDVIASTPTQFSAKIKSEIAQWTKIIKDSGITPQ